MFPFFALAVAHAEDLYVSSNEKNAAILINGVDTGHRTPATVPGVAPGRTLVTVEGACSRGEAVVDVLPGLTARASIVATEQLGTITVIPAPQGARLELDNGLFPGATGVALAVGCGEHTLQASLEGYVPAIVTVEVGMGQDLSVPISLTKLGLGSLELSVSPRPATILLDGKPIGSDAVSLPSVYQGVHTISAELDGYQSVKKQLVVADGSSQAYHFDLYRSSQKRQSSTVTQIGEEASGDRTSGASAVAVEAVADTGEEARLREEDRQRAAAKAREAARREIAEREASEQRGRESDEDEQREAAAARAAERREQEEADAAERKAELDRERKAAAAREADRRELEEAEDERETKQAGETKQERELKPRAEPANKKPIGKTLAGVGLLAAGVGGGVYSVIAFDATQQAYAAYNSKLSAAGRDKQLQRLADTYYDETVAPRSTAFYGSAAGTALFLAGGVVVLAIDSHLPTPVPAAGGGMLLWSGRF